MNTLSNKIRRIIDLCNEGNIPFRNLLHKDFLPEELDRIYSELEKNDDVDIFEVWEIIREKIQIDDMKISKYYLWDIAVEEKNNIVLEKFSELNERIDKDELITVPFNSDFNKNGFRYKDRYLIFEDAFSHNFHLTEWLIRNWKNDFILNLPINKNCLGLPETRRNVILKSHWQGPKKLDHVKKSLNGKEFVIKGGPFSGPLMDKTEFLFYYKNNNWHFQIEELIPLEGVVFRESICLHNKEHKFYTKYVHAITDSKLSSCNHIDGAIRVYDTYEKFKERNLTNLKNTKIRKCCENFKLFRIDSKTGIKSFQEIIGLFLIGNPYVLEFFEGETSFTKDMEKTRAGILEIDFKHRGYLV